MATMRPRTIDIHKKLPVIYDLGGDSDEDVDGVVGDTNQEISSHRDVIPIPNLKELSPRYAYPGIKEDFVRPSSYIRHQGKLLLCS
jgi:hypothetical protein